MEGVPANAEERTDEQQARWLLGQLVEWHRREDKPAWWAYFDLKDKTIEELVAAPEALGDLSYQGVVGQAKQSLIHRYTYDPAQEHKFKEGDKTVDPATDSSAGTVVAVDLANGSIDLKRGKNSPVPHPRALIPAKPIATTPLRKAIAAIADSVLANGIDGPGPYRAVRELLLRRPPRVRGVKAGAPLVPEGEDAAAAARRLGLLLEESYLPIQGPPGSGKTCTGARMILDLVKKGRRVGVTATAHKAIDNLLKAVREAADEERVRLRIIQKPNGDDDEEASGDERLTLTSKAGDVAAGLASGEFQIGAGTPWLFARDELQGSVDVLFLDEAGQMSLANVVAMARAARSLVLLGDPNQLPQVTQGTHPEGAGLSSLEHVLNRATTIPPDRGLFLDRTWRLHPEICSYISEAFYEGRLLPRPANARQRAEADAPYGGVGIRFLPVSHAFNTARSTEEAEIVAEAIARLLGRPWVDQHGRKRKLRAEDILVVAPYNAQVGEISRRTHERTQQDAHVGTVDKFQGQEGAVVLYSMATSTPDDAPRTMDFLYSRHRLNVAISRARAVAVLICSPDLLRVTCRTAEQMRLANAFCRFVEAAGHCRSGGAQ